MFALISLCRLNDNQTSISKRMSANAKYIQVFEDIHKELMTSELLDNIGQFVLCDNRIVQ